MSDRLTKVNAEVMEGDLSCAEELLIDQWTLERRKKHSEKIQNGKPWENSTGPLTAQGRATSRMNALKHSMRSAKMRSLESATAVLAKFEREAGERVG